MICLTQFIVFQFYFAQLVEWNLFALATMDLTHVHKAHSILKL